MGSSGSQPSQAQPPIDPLYPYLDPTLADAGPSNTDNTSSFNAAVPLPASNLLSSIPTEHQLASSAPQQTSTTTATTNTAPPPRPPPPKIKEEPVTPDPLSDIPTVDTSASAQVLPQGHIGGKMPTRASKQPSKAPAPTRSSKRRLSTSTAKSTEEIADTQRRSTRQKSTK